MSQLIRTLALAAATATVVFAGKAHALDASVSVSYTGEYTTNTAQAADDETGEFIQRPALNLGLSHSGPSTTASANYQVMRRIHQEGTFRNETVTTGTGRLGWDALPERLSFFATNSRTDTTVDSRGRNTPDNRQTVDYTTVGSNLTLDSISNHTIRLGYSYGISSAEETRTDSSRHSVTGTYAVPLSPGRELTLQGSYIDVDFDDDLSSDYNARSGSLGYTSTTNILTLATNAGYQSTRRELGRSDVNGFIGNASAAFNVSDLSTVTFRAARTIQDNFDSGGRGTIDFPDDLPDRTDTNEIYTSNRFDASFNTQMGRNRIDVTTYHDTRYFRGGVSDETSTGATFGVSRQFTPSSTLDLNLSVENREFEQDNRKDRFNRAQVRYTLARWQAFSMNFSLSYVERDSDVSSADYNEWNGTVTLNYLLYGSR